MPWPSRRVRPESGHLAARKWAPFVVTVVGRSSSSFTIPHPWTGRPPSAKPSGWKRFWPKNTNEPGSIQIEFNCPTNQFALKTSRCGRPPTMRQTESEWLPHKPTKKEAENQLLAREAQTLPRISFSPWMQNCTPRRIASSLLDWVSEEVSPPSRKSPALGILSVMRFSGNWLQQQRSLR